MLLLVLLALPLRPLPVLSQAVSLVPSTFPQLSGSSYGYAVRQAPKLQEGMTMVASRASHVTPPWGVHTDVGRRARARTIKAGQPVLSDLEPSGFAAGLGLGLAPGSDAKIWLNFSGVIP
ncbi:hypothetical protein BDP55DRAFT_220339 [Colletotrichum godetiae]|uniref:Uncharacterized protein n=1 Tax=Colletotrichum godetiae TaxID=1209918 RepID=A0AAJ0AGT8_9PEZI|nr:uncharacterized protein BDP55DRAFT_220339 [Colletotrichum godetiae]KAK1673638.1 hypothetical protein BDP55DRAFT_220339 [Colletotrichum godetiae]